MSKLAEAIALAAKAHKNQYDKQGEPYILHCIAVMNNRTWVRDDREKIVAVLHDVVEDSDMIWNDVAKVVGPEDAWTVLTLTRHEGEDYFDYIARVKESKVACRIKLADLEHNMDIKRLKGLTNKDFNRLQKYHLVYRDLREYHAEHYS